MVARSHSVATIQRTVLFIMHHCEVILYTRVGCHLCEEALTILRKYGLEPALVDIDHHPDKLVLYNECVPVVEIDGKVYFRGRVNEVLLRRLLH